MKRLFNLSVLSLLLLGACGLEEPEPEVQAPDPETGVSETESPEKEEVDPHEFFRADGTIAYFKGEGNEFAQFTQRTVHLDDDHIAIYEDNGGTTVLRVYRISEDKIELVKEEPEFYEEYSATSEELKQLEPVSVYLEFPLEKGMELEGRTLVETGATVETPYQTFDDAYIFESPEADGNLSRWAFVEGFGEVKREFIIQEEAGSAAVTSTLESVE